MKLRHPNILPPVVIDVADDRVAEHLAAGWVPDEAPEVSTPTERPRRTTRAGSDSQKETAA